MKKLLLILCLGILIVSCEDENKEKTAEKKSDKKIEETNKKIQKKSKNFEPRIIKDEKTGEYIIQVYVPETATHDEIYNTIMDIQLKKRKDFLKDNIIIVAYSDEDFINKHLMGTHAQWKMEKGATKYMKILPRTEQLSPKNKKNYLEYLQLVNSFLDYGDNLEKSKQEAEPIMRTRHPKDYKEIIKEANKYLYGIENEKTEEEKLMDSADK